MTLPRPVRSYAPTTNALPAWRPPKPKPLRGCPNGNGCGWSGIGGGIGCRRGEWGGWGVVWAGIMG